jgi:septal ring-binding cell division protein DamX
MAVGRRTLAGFFCLLTCNLAAPTRLDAQALREPPVWPTPQEYLSKKTRNGQDARDAGTVAGERSTAVQGKAPGEAPEKAGGSVTVAPLDSSLTPYTVQIAAFRRYPAARESLAAADESRSILRSVRGGETWYVVVLGLYSSRAEAAAAEAEYRAANPGADTWLRSTAGLTPAAPDR